MKKGLIYLCCSYNRLHYTSVFGSEYDSVGELDWRSELLEVLEVMM